LQQVSEQVRSVPQRGLGYGLLKYLRRDEELGRKLRQRVRARVSFNYLGQVDNAVSAGSMYRLAGEGSGAGRSERGERSYELEVNGSVRGGELLVSWNYSRAEHERAEIERIGERYLGALRQLLRECREARVERGYSVADFPLARVDQATLERVIAERGEVEDIYGLTPMQ
jgi:non-ribosomal peptide synthase protein (TIGR01720 family)